MSGFYMTGLKKTLSREVKFTVTGDRCVWRNELTFVLQFCIRFGFWCKILNGILTLIAEKFLLFLLTRRPVKQLLTIHCHHAI